MSGRGAKEVMTVRELPDDSEIELAALKAERDRLLRELQDAKDLNLRWNLAAGKSYAGSEFKDDPERVFSFVRGTQQTQMESLCQAKRDRDALLAALWELVKAVKEEVSAVLKAVSDGAEPPKPTQETK